MKAWHFDSARYDFQTTHLNIDRPTLAVDQEIIVPGGNVLVQSNLEYQADFIFAEIPSR